LQILPSRTRGARVPDQPVHLLDVPAAPIDRRVREHLPAGCSWKAGTRYWRYGAVFDDLRSQALGTAGSADLIAGLAAAAP